MKPNRSKALIIGPITCATILALVGTSWAVDPIATPPLPPAPAPVSPTPTEATPPPTPSIPVPVPPPKPQSPPNVAALIIGLKVAEGPWAGTFRVAPAEERLNWYACNQALYPLVNLDNYGLIRTYLNQYLNHVDPKTGVIPDYDLASSQPTPASADDVTAASFLSLAVRYRNITNNQVWWNRNSSAMKTLARQVLLGSQKKSGLTRPLVAGSAQSASSLMNNCEVYRGLKDLANVLKEENDPDAAKFETAAALVAKGIAALFDEETQAFRVSDQPWEPTFSPDRVAQVFPELFRVPLGSESETQRKYEAAWKYLNANSDAWESGTLTDTNDQSLTTPYMLLGYTAAKRDNYDRSKKQLDYFLEKLGQTPPPAPFTTLQELGFALRIQTSPNRF